MGDNGTAGKNAALNTVNGKKLIGKKGTMEECGALVPMIANWPGKIQKGVVTKALIDASDFLPTFADLTGATLPTNKKIDQTSNTYVVEEPLERSTKRGRQRRA